VALSDQEPEIRAQAALRLADAGTVEAVPSLLVVATNDTEPRARQMALLALGELADENDAGVISALSAAQRADEASERFQALLALHQLGAAAAEAALIEGTVDPDPEVRRLAFRVAEARFLDRELPELLRARARGALGDNRPLVRVAAALLLAAFGDASGRQTVLDLISGRIREASLEDEQAAIDHVVRLDLREASAALERRAYGLLSRDPLAYNARIALAALGDERASAAILRGLSAWTATGRTLAVVAAGRAGLSAALPRLETFRGRPDLADPDVVEEALERIRAGSSER
jgi:HEAT repeat protein